MCTYPRQETDNRLKYGYYPSPTTRTCRFYWEMFKYVGEGLFNGPEMTQRQVCHQKLSPALKNAFSRQFSWSEPLPGILASLCVFLGAFLASVSSRNLMVWAILGCLAYQCVSQKSLLFIQPWESGVQYLVSYRDSLSV